MLPRPPLPPDPVDGTAIGVSLGVLIAPVAQLVIDELAEHIDLIVIFVLRKCLQLVSEVRKPGSLAKEQELSLFDFSEASIEPLLLAHDLLDYDESLLTL